MRTRGAAFACAASAAAGVLSAVLIAGPATGSPGTTTATTPGPPTLPITTVPPVTVPPVTTTPPVTPPVTTTPPVAPPVTTAPPPVTTTPPPPAPVLVPEGVTIGGVSVGGFRPADAEQLLRVRFDEPLPVVLGTRMLLVPPTQLGASARIAGSVERALASPEGAKLPLGINVNALRTRAWVRMQARRFDRSPIESEVRLRGVHPFVTKSRVGREIRQRRAVTALVRALRANSRERVVIPYGSTQPALTRANFGPVIVIRRGQKTLWLYRGMRLWRTFGVAVGQPAWPTPLGRFEIVVKWRNPWWYPPSSSWAKGSSPVPPGPSNPLGTRWMGLSSPGVGIHGTPHPSSIGYSASHGCIRMLIPQAEWLFERVPVGTPVFIVSA